MPQRFLRPGIRQSERWNRCSYFTQSLYLRLLTLVDDYGRYEAHPMLIRNEAFPFGDPDGADIPVGHVVDGLDQLEQRNLISRYKVGDKSFLQLLRWKEKARADSKFPAPPANICSHGDNKCLPPSPSPSSSPSINLASPDADRGGCNGTSSLFPDTGRSGNGHAKPKTDTSLLREEWSKAYKTRFGYDYVHSGAKDANAEKKLLLKATVQEIIDVAKKAWGLMDRKDAYRCKGSTTLATLAANWSALRPEIDRFSKQSPF